MHSRRYRTRRACFGIFLLTVHLHTFVPASVLAQINEAAEAVDRVQPSEVLREHVRERGEASSGANRSPASRLSPEAVDKLEALGGSSGPQGLESEEEPPFPPGDPGGAGGSQPRAPEGNPVGGQAIALPSGAGSVSGLGESFRADLSTGAATLNIPIPQLPARGGASATLALSYSSGAGNGLIGLGWNTGVPYIARQTDKGVPRYDDRAAFHVGQDRFVFNGAELIPLGVVENGEAPAAPGETMPPWSSGWQYFRPRAEAEYSRFFWSPAHRTWRVQAGQSGTTLEFGVPLDGSNDENALEVSTEGQDARIYRWNLARAYDTQGTGKPFEDAEPHPINVTAYRYMHDGGITYLSDVYDTPAASSAPLAEYAHHTRFVWGTRDDVVSNYRRGWRVEQRFRLSRVDLTSKTYANVSAPRRQVKRMHLGYDETSHVSLLTSVSLEGRCSGDEGSAPAEDGNERLSETTSCPSLPPTVLSYSHVTPASPIATAPGFEPFDGAMREAVDSPLLSLDANLGVMLVDWNGDGLPDVLDGDSGRNAGKHRVFFNGHNGLGAAFAPARSVSITPVVLPDGRPVDGFDLSLKSSSVVPLDFDADGTLDLVLLQRFRVPAVFSPKTESGALHWQVPPASVAENHPAPELQLTRDRTNTRVADANGDGLVDILVTTGTELHTYLSLARSPGGEGAFGASTPGVGDPQLSGEAIRTCLPASNGVVSFSDPRVQLADINADGLVDIVRLKRGHFEYWPGRGDGHWGVGDLRSCGASAFSAPIVMANPPFPSVSDEEVRYGDLNADGFADAIAVEGTAVVVWLNVDGVRWTSPFAIPKGPFVGTSKKTTQIADFDGSGTPDIVFGDAGRYRYIDVLGGVHPRMLTGIASSLGQSTSVEYSMSVAEMLNASSGTGWTSTVPSVVPVVKRVTVSDNLDKLGKPLGRYTTSYDYADPFFDKRGPSFRGFRTVVVHEHGPDGSIGQSTRTHFHVGECADEDAPGRCARRDAENPRDALRGLVRAAETFDEGGTTLSTAHTTYRLRTLFSGLDGREVRAVFPSASDTFVYETSPFSPSPGSVTVVDVERESGTGQVLEETSALALPSAGRVHTRSETLVNRLGQVTETHSLGCIEGCSAVDESIVETTLYAQVPGDLSGWLYRPVESYVTGSHATAPRHHVLHAYDGLGRLTQTSAELEGTLPLLRSHAGAGAMAPSPSTASQDGTIVTSSTVAFDVYGHPIDVRGAGGRCFKREYDASYGELPVLEVLSAGPEGGYGCGTRDLVTTAIYDRGLRLATSVVGYNGERGEVTLDGFGRTASESLPDPDVLGAVSPLPAKTYEYVMPTSALPRVGVHGRTHVGASKSDATYVDDWTFSDALGRPLVQLAPADPTHGDGGDWIAQGVVSHDGFGRIERAYLPWFWSGDPAQFPFSLAPPTASERRTYDTFSRAVSRFAVDNVEVERAVYHPLATDRWDAGDLSNGPHAGTYATSVVDGHGRSIATVERLRVGGAMQSIETRVERLPTGEPKSIVRSRLGSMDAPVVRWMLYDSLGRLVLNAEPNSTVGFTATPPNDTTGLRTWRYAYDDAGQLVGTSDARGCGANYFFDTAGRPLAEDRSPCLDSQPAYSTPNLGTGEGTEVFYRYDEPDPELEAITTEPGSSADGGVEDDAGALDAAQSCPEGLSNWLGRVSSVASLGDKSIVVSDGRGRPVCGAKRVALPGAPASDLTLRYAPRWYVRQFGWDGANRVAAATTGARSPELVGTGGQSELHATYTRRGDVASIGGSYGTLVQSRVLDALGLPQQVVYGDLANTTTASTYDVRHRLAAVQTTRGAPGLWSVPSGSYTPPASGTPTLQAVLEDGELVYDDADNPVELLDHRDPAEWPSSARPASRTISYDDLYRVVGVQYAYEGGSDAWTSPFQADLNAIANSQPAHAHPSPHVSFDDRILEATYTYDFRGNITSSSDDAQGFYDRSLGNQQHSATAPYQLISASSTATPRGGHLDTLYDAAGNLEDLVVVRDGPCLPAISSCVQRFLYEWSETGELARARRWDLTSVEAPLSATTGAAVPDRAPDAELRYAYSTGRQRVVKTAVDPLAAERHDVFIFDTLELRRSIADTDYELTEETETVYLAFGGARLGRVYYAENDLPSVQSGHQHVFLELSDHLGSTSIVIDKETSELVERATYTSYGQAESDYRPARWDSFRERYRFTGKEDDAELGLVSIGKRYYSPALHRWLSPDPLAVHSPGSADLNVYAYVHGRPYVAVDPDGELPVLAALLVGIVVGALVSGGSSAGVQYAATGRVNWGWDGVAGAAVAGGIGGGATAGLGAVGAGMWAGAAGGAASSATSAAMSGQRAGGIAVAGLLGAGAGLAGAAVSSVVNNGALMALEPTGIKLNAALHVSAATSSIVTGTAMGLAVEGLRDFGGASNVDYGLAAAVGAGTGAAGYAGSAAMGGIPQAGPAFDTAEGATRYGNWQNQSMANTALPIREAGSIQYEWGGYYYSTKNVVSPFGKNISEEVMLDGASVPAGGRISGFTHAHTPPDTNDRTKGNTQPSGGYRGFGGFHFPDKQEADAAWIRGGRPHVWVEGISTPEGRLEFYYPRTGRSYEQPRLRGLPGGL